MTTTTTTTTSTYLDVETLSLEAVYRQLAPEIEALDTEGFEYFSIASSLRYDAPVRVSQPIGRTRWFACYAVTGGSEGYYVHVDRIYQAEPYAREFTHEPIFLFKTFAGYDMACTVAAYLGRRLGA